MAEQTALDFSGKEQLYSQLYDILFQNIISGVYTVGDLIPSESELMRSYGVSRATARKAMEMLSNNGLITKRRGKGSEVISQVPATSLQHVNSYVKKGVVDNGTPQKRLLEAKVMPAPSEVAENLKLDTETKVYCMRRVRYAGEVPFYYEVIYYPDGYAPGITSRDFSKESLRAYLADKCGITWSRAEQKIYSCAATDELAELLDVEPGTPLLLIKRVSYDQHNDPREAVDTYYRADLYHLEIELRSE